MFDESQNKYVKAYEKSVQSNLSQLSNGNMIDEASKSLGRIRIRELRDSVIKHGSGSESKSHPDLNVMGSNFLC